MRAVSLDAFDAAPAVRDDLPGPTAAAGGMVVRVRASSVNPVDNAIAAGMLRWRNLQFLEVNAGRAS